MSEAPASKIRIDKWLWQARFFKTRSLSAKVVSGGSCRVNGTPVAKPAFMVAPGDVLTFSKEREVRVIKVLALGERRGPAPEAQALYEDLSPPEPKSGEDVPPIRRLEGNARPTKRDRRKLDLDRRREVE
ncbi:RNA-binding S4 domain-containing protein [Mameliella sediminis]|uniref:RNA-binding S4 domain-containing protein n=1 Tax=Mameliella sediminis TaxID=2836866 RepID=UPI001C479848|nr:RNA-binding S4 domain-containing protein [Mameliella sediminis]MBY6116214.1 RNA-binding S4 domain-containing protein [Antarctobacter heliothermus]MBY6146179.1 RNA-binding S4 domain-containing protein [Mameliella alba]MBV7396828.1 RNA-binding S4 domain-containing protein [Mameliella sediminis]MBY6161836.1 RNA-binding S4 domain-containing protein [Mameliella alba]MBY6170306.1 RNA-binding S4 domain-containing protein [Mameliella alba]